MTQLVQRDSAGEVKVFRVKRDREKKRKGSRSLRGLEKAVRKLVDAEQRFSQEYSERHRKSNRKKKDGWLRDLGDNFSKAGKKARKGLKVRRLFRL